MPDAVPRRLFTELVTRWQLTRERLLVVEGSEDRRTIALLQGEGHFSAAFTSLAVLEADAIDVTAKRC